AASRSPNTSSAVTDDKPKKSSAALDRGYRRTADGDWRCVSGFRLRPAGTSARYRLACDHDLCPVAAMVGPGRLRSPVVGPIAAALRDGLTVADPATSLAVCRAAADAHTAAKLRRVVVLAAAARADDRLRLPARQGRLVHRLGDV